MERFRWKTYHINPKDVLTLKPMEVSIRTNFPDIRNILVNKEKRLVTVVFADGMHEIIKCSENDEFDVNVGVALAIAQHLYGTKNRFHKEIEKKIRYSDKKSGDKKCKKN